MKCTATTKKGTPCTFNAAEDSDVCQKHLVPVKQSEPSKSVELAEQLMSDVEFLAEFVDDEFTRLYRYCPYQKIWRGDGKDFIKRRFPNLHSNAKFQVFSIIRDTVDKVNEWNQMDLMSIADRCITFRHSKIYPHKSIFKIRNTRSFSWDDAKKSKGLINEFIKKHFFLDEELIYDMCSYILATDGINKRFFVLFGETDTGKTTLALILEKLLGEVECIWQDLKKYGGGQYDIDYFRADLIGKKLLVFDENTATSINTATLKQLTGGWNKAQGRSIRGKPEYFRKKPIPILTCNIRDFPSISNDTNFFNRMRLIPAEIEIEEPDDEFVDKVLCSNVELSKFLHELFVHYKERKNEPDFLLDGWTAENRYILWELASQKENLDRILKGVKRSR